MKCPRPGPTWSDTPIRGALSLVLARRNPHEPDLSVVLTFSPRTRVWLGVDPAEIRNSFNGLFGAVKGTLLKDPLSSRLFYSANDPTRACGPPNALARAGLMWT